MYNEVFSHNEFESEPPEQLTPEEVISPILEQIIGDMYEGSENVPANYLISENPDGSYSLLYDRDRQQNGFEESYTIIVDGKNIYSVRGGSVEEDAPTVFYDLSQGDLGEYFEGDEPAYYKTVEYPDGRYVLENVVVYNDDGTVKETYRQVVFDPSMTDDPSKKPLNIIGSISNGTDGFRYYDYTQYIGDDGYFSVEYLDSTEVAFNVKADLDGDGELSFNLPRMKIEYFSEGGNLFDNVFEKLGEGGNLLEIISEFDSNPNYPNSMIDNYRRYLSELKNKENNYIPQ